jgi:diphthine-ammonia ligase
MLNRRAAVLWTGGKDCNLALYEAKKAGYDIIALITFAIGESRFLAHPVHVMKQQAQALRITHLIIPVSEPYKESYEHAIAEIKQTHAIATLVTGDIAEVHGNSNWITERSKPCGMEVYLPLWQLKREHLLQQLMELNFKTIFSCVKEPWFTQDWLGRELNGETLEELKLLHENKGLDICGEQGEYHTLVLDGPEYKQELAIDAFVNQKEDALFYMKIGNVVLLEKQTA